MAQAGMGWAFGPLITAMLRMFLKKYSVKYGEPYVWD